MHGFGLYLVDRQLAELHRDERRRVALDHRAAPRGAATTTTTALHMPARPASVRPQASRWRRAMGRGLINLGYRVSGCRDALRGPVTSGADLGA